ncbi:hypothetical protein MHBO_002286, partial [Bonamia ostreae]
MANFRDIIFAVIENLDKLPEKFAKKLVKCQNVILPLTVKKKIWEIDEKSFDREINRILKIYCDSANSNYKKIYHKKFVFPKSRRKVNTNLQILVETIKNSQILSSKLIYNLEQIYFKNFDRLVMTLRFDAIMGLNDNGQQNLQKIDYCYNFIRCIDDCITENRADSSHLDNLKNVVLSVPEDKNLVAKMAAVASNPLLRSFLCKAILHRINVVVSKQQLPKKDLALIFFSQLLLFSLENKNIIKEEISVYPKVIFYQISLFLTDLIKFSKTNF